MYVLYQSMFPMIFMNYERKDYNSVKKLPDPALPFFIRNKVNTTKNKKIQHHELLDMKHWGEYNITKTSS